MKWMIVLLALAAFTGDAGRVKGKSNGALIEQAVENGNHARTSRTAPPKPQFNQGMHERQPREMAEARPNDEVIVHWNLSPLMAETFGHKIGDWFSIFHVSVGFTNTRTGMNSTAEFAADKFGASLLVPAQDNAARAMMWDNSAKVKLYEGELDTYYWSNRTKTATINGIKYNAMLEWFETAIKDYTKYDLFALESRAGGLKLQEDPLFGGFTCFQFARAAIQKLADLAGPCVFDRSLPGVFVNDVMLLQADDGPEQSRVTSAAARPFYEAMNKIPKLMTLDIKEIFDEMTRGAQEWNEQAIYHSSAYDTHWAYKPRAPFFQVSTGFAPLPGKCAQNK